MVSGATDGAHSPDEDREAGAERIERQLVLSVSDTGVGIAPTFLPYVFEWFRQEDARSRSQSGLGLGLGIVREIMQRHGGRVEVESTLGRGTRVRLHFRPLTGQDASGA